MIFEKKIYLKGKIVVVFVFVSNIKRIDCDRNY